MTHKMADFDKRSTISFLCRCLSSFILHNERPDLSPLLYSLPVPQSLASVGFIAAQLNFEPYKAVCGSLMTQRLLSPGGVRGLCRSILGDGMTSEGPFLSLLSFSLDRHLDLVRIAAPLQKLESIAKILSTVPAGMKIEVDASFEEQVHSTVC